MSVTAAQGFVASGIWAAFLDDRSPTATALVHDAMWRDRWGALAQVLLAGSGAVAVLLSYGERMRDEHVAEYYALLTAAGAGMAFFVQASNLMTLFLALEWFSISLYILCAIDRDRIGGLEAALKYLVIASGFTRTAIEFRSPVPEQDRLQPVAVPVGATPAFSDLAEAFNGNVEKLNARIFTYLDYAVVGDKAP